MANYRLNVHHSDFELDYWKEFHLFGDYISKVVAIIDQIKRSGASRAWYFFEPYLEITYVCDPHLAPQIKEAAEKMINEQFPSAEIKYLTPEDGKFQDWFCKNDLEYSFGGIRHDICYQWVENYNNHRQGVDGGKGVKEQVKRTIHTLCNPLGLNYTEEAKICFSRGLICLLFKWWPKRAVWIYTKIFRQKY